MLIKADSIVLNFKRHGLRARSQFDPDFTSIGMAENISKRFLDDSINCKLHIFVQGLRGVRMLKVDGRTAALKKTAALAFDGGGQAKVVECCRMQTPRQAMNIVRDVDELALDIFEPLSPRDRARLGDLL